MALLNCPSTHQMVEDYWLLIWSIDFSLWKLFYIVLLSICLRGQYLHSKKKNYYKLDHHKQNWFVFCYHFPEINFPIKIYYFQLLPLLPGSLLQVSKWFPCSRLHSIKSILHTVVKVLFVDYKSDCEILAWCSLKILHEWRKLELPFYPLRLWMAWFLLMLLYLTTPLFLLPVQIHSGI